MRCPSGKRTPPRFRQRSRPFSMKAKRWPSMLS
jgi:hypothetical protein